MRLHRVVMVELRPVPTSLHKFSITASNGVRVHVSNFDSPASAPSSPEGLSIAIRREVEHPPARVCVVAEQDVTVDPYGERPQLQHGITDECDFALHEMVNQLAVITQAQTEVFSPRPYLFLESETDDELAALDANDIHIPPMQLGGVRLAPGSEERVDFHELLADRRNGVSLLGSALAARRGVAKLHDLIRVFENGFAKAGVPLVDPLTQFLRSHPWDLGYTKGEVKTWIKDLRDSAVHADMKWAKQIFLDPDVEPHLPRIEQAAYDVLFNKRDWHKAGPERLDRWGFTSMVRADGTAVVTDGGVLNGATERDHFQAFRLNELYRMGDEWLPANWRAVDWYFPEGRHM